MEQSRLVIFDLDGTLFRTETVDVEAFNKALEHMGYSKRNKFEILRLIGLTLESICSVLLDTTDVEKIDTFRKLVINYEENLIAESGELYNGVIDFLKRLKEKRITLCICSNGNVEYVSAIARKFGFYSIFEEIWSERKGISKLEAVGILKRKYKADKFIMIGDRLCDIEAGRLNGGASIGATYGFGGDEPDMADIKVNSIRDLEEAIYKFFEIK